MATCKKIEVLRRFRDIIRGDRFQINNVGGTFLQTECGSVDMDSGMSAFFSDSAEVTLLIRAGLTYDYKDWRYELSLSKKQREILLNILGSRSGGSAAAFEIYESLKHPRG